MNPDYLAAFSEIVSLYQERKDVGSFDPMTLETDPGAPQRTYLNPKPTVSDFIADVELTATRVLDEQQLRFWHHWYRALKADASEPPIMHTDKVVRAILGKGFIDRGIFPIQKYLGTQA